MRKKQLFTIFMLILFLSSFSPSTPVLVLGGSPQPPDISPKVNAISSEEENIDSMDVFPSNRWSVTNNGFTAEISAGLLNMSDVGDGTDDFFQINRDLRDLNGKIEVRFKVSVNESSADFQDSFYIKLLDSSGTFEASLLIEVLQNNAISTTSLRMTQAVSGFSQKGVDVDERVFEDLWYVFRIDYDLLKTECRFRLFFDNNTKVFDYDYFDIDPINRLGIFAQTDLVLRIQSRSKGVTVINFVDYVQAPFKEREWKQIDTPSDSDWLVDSWGNARVQDNIDDSSGWQLVVPYLDTVTATIFTNTSDNDVFISGAAGDRVTWFFRIFAVDGDDGDLHELFEVTIGFFEIIANTFRVDFGLQFGGVTLAQGAFDFTSNYTSISPRVAFSVGLTEDRSEAVMNTRLSLNGTFRDAIDFSAGGSVSGIATDPSQEFLLRFSYDAELDADVEWFAFLDDFGLKERGIFSDWFIANAPGALENVATAVASGDDILTILFRWLGDLLANAFGFVGDLLVDTFGFVGDLIISALEALEPFLTIISDAITGLVDLFVAAVGDFIDEVIIVLLSILADLTDVIVGIVFFIWDALSLPDILAVFDTLLVGFGQAVAGFGQFVTDINNLIGNIFTISVTAGLFVFFFLPITISPTIGQWIEKVMEFMAFDITFGFSPWNVVPRVPAGAVWIAIVIGSGVLSGSILGGFF